MKKWLLRSPSTYDFIQLLKAWRVWILAAVAGALLGYGLFYIYPPEYRAQASVNVDHNLELAWSEASKERDLMTYLSRETQKLEEVAWDDATLQMVADENPGVSIAALRDGILQLSQPSEGAWHFWADDPNPEQAARLASAWAKVFYEITLDGIETAVRLQAAQAAILQPEADTEILTQQIISLEKDTLAISPYLQIHLSQVEQLPVHNTYNFMTATLSGAAIAWVLCLLIILFIGERPEKNEER